MDSAFWFTFAGYTSAPAGGPAHDLDLASYGVVKFGRGRRDGSRRRSSTRSPRRTPPDPSILSAPLATIPPMLIADDSVKLGRAARRALAVIRENDYYAQPGPDEWEALAASEYASFARQALDAAAARGAAVQSGALPYAADKAFTTDEVNVLGRATRVALLRDEPWLPALLGRLLPAIAVAPTAAKTLPSQALLFEVARSVRDFPTPEAASALRKVRGIIRHRGVPVQLDRNFKKIDAALADRPDAAFRLPDLGFGADGVFRATAGAYEGTVTVADEVTLTWRRSGGGELRGVPAAIRRDHPDELQLLRDLVKTARAHIATATRALEGGLVVSAPRPYERWRTEFAAHPLGRPLAERLIWEMEVAPGEWRAALPVDGGLLDSAGRPFGAVDAGTAVRLWHPVRAPLDEIRAWRDLLIARQVRQPFKQAFREIYLLTPAELETRDLLQPVRRAHPAPTGGCTRCSGPVAGRRRGCSGRGTAATRRTRPASSAGRRWRARFFHSYVEPEARASHRPGAVRAPHGRRLARGGAGRGPGGRVQRGDAGRRPVRGGHLDRGRPRLGRRGRGPPRRVLAAARASAS